MIQGWVIVVKVVLGSLPIYYLSIFKASVQVINKLEGMRPRYLWEGDEEKIKISWIKLG